MQTFKKLISNQFFIIAIILLLYPINLIIEKYAINYSSDYYSIPNYVNLVLASFYGLFIVIVTPFFMSNKNKKWENIKKENLIIRGVYWLMTFIFISFFLYFMYDELIASIYHISFFSDLWYILTRWFRWSVIIDTEFGLLNDIKIITLYSPWLIASILFYWLIKINKKNDSEDINLKK